MNENRKLKSSLHTHVRSVDDGDITAEELSDEIIALGGTSCAITDHGSVAAIEDYRRVFEKKGLKLIPGCELYVEGGIFGRRHLIVLAKNDNGWKGIGKIVTAANLNIEKGYPVITIAALNKVMKSYKGDIIALSACMQGVVCSCFLMNRTVNEKINSLRYRQMKHISPSSNEYSDAEEASRDAERQLEELTITRDRLKEIAEQKFKKRETYAKKLEKTDPEGAKREYEKIASDKEEAERAEAQLVIIKSDLTSAKKAASEAAKALKEVSSSIDKWFKIEGEINELSKNLVSEEEMEKNAETNTQTMLKIFGKDCFFMEMQYHGIKEERECFPKAAKIAHKFGIPLVATNDVHILRNTEDDRLKRQILRSMRFKKWANEEPGDKELYLKTDEELSEWLSKILPPEDVKEAINNIGVVADLCNVEFKTGKHYPKFGAEDSNKLLEAEIEKGIKWRFPNGMDEAHKERLKKELPIIESMGYSDYHLIVKDFLEYGRLLGYLPKEKIADAPITIPELESYIQENGWHNMGLMTGPGRGSAVGSLVCYLLGITTLDPLKYNLLFERFLNPERISMPDIDSDFANTIRPKVIQYVQNKYGYNAVCGILTVIKLQPKGAINTAAKYYGLKKNGEGMLSLGDKLSSDVPNALNIAFSTKVDKNGAVDEDGESDYTLYQFLKDKYDGNEDALEILRWAKILEGTVSGFSAHAAGIVISDNDDVSEYLPLRMNEKLGMLTTQCDMVELEDNGLLKFDFLGLKTLDIITETLKAIEETTGIIIDPLTIDLTDKSVYEDIFQKGKTNSVFQFSSQGMKAMLKRFKPQSFEDLIILNSMFRPGPKCLGIQCEPYYSRVSCR